MRDKLIERCIKTIVGDNDRRLVDFAFGKSITQANLDEFLASWDIEVAGADKALLLAYVMRQRADLVFPPYTGPRLRGLINRYRFDNLRLIAHFSRITKALNAAGVIPLVLKGGAMRAMRPDLPRNMGDIDILVRGREDFAKARETACALGYRLVENSHAIDLHEQGSEAGVLDIHSHLDINPASAGIDVAPLFYGARRMQVFGAEAYVPSAEAMMFVLLQNLSKNLKFKCSMSGVLYSLFDADYLTSSGSDFDWERVWSLTGHFGAGSYVALALQFMDRLRPGALPPCPERFLEDLDEECEERVFLDTYLLPVKMRCKDLRILRSLRSWNALRDYAVFEIRHKYYKWVRRKPSRIRAFLSRCKEVGRED